jgi:hypothetical protein
MSELSSTIDGWIVTLLGLDPNGPSGAPPTIASGVRERKSRSEHFTCTDPEQVLDFSSLRKSLMDREMGEYT